MTNSEPRPEDHRHWNKWIEAQDECPDNILLEFPAGDLAYVQQNVLPRGVKCMALATYFNLLPNPYFAPFPPCVRQEGCAIVQDEFKDIVREEFPEATLPLPPGPESPQQ